MGNFRPKNGVLGGRLCTRVDQGNLPRHCHDFNETTLLYLIDQVLKHTQASKETSNCTAQTVPCRHLLLNVLKAVKISLSRASLAPDLFLYSLSQEVAPSRLIRDSCFSLVLSSKSSLSPMCFSETNDLSPSHSR